MAIFFSDFFNVSPDLIEEYGAFNISLINDLPLFVDPFLLFNSEKPDYQQLHKNIICYMRFLKEISLSGKINPPLIDAWFTFPEVKQNWLGFSETGNKGHGLGKDFANALNKNLYSIFRDFGEETITRSSHLEKLCLVREGVGRDNISDFTTNLIKHFLATYTQEFALKHLSKNQIKSIKVSKVNFNYNTRTWAPATFQLPYINGDFVLLTPKDILTKDESWINRPEFLNRFQDIADSLPNQVLRGQVNEYLLRILPDGLKANKKEIEAAISSAVDNFPEVIDYYIKVKEDESKQATEVAEGRVAEVKALFVEQINQLVNQYLKPIGFYNSSGNTYFEAKKRVIFLKYVIENQGGHSLFYVNGKPIERESDLRILYRLTWFSTPSNLNREVNDGCGTVDFKVSPGKVDKVLVEFKLASNAKLENYLVKHCQIYGISSLTYSSLKIIMFFSTAESNRVNQILERLKLQDSPQIILIDARNNTNNTNYINMNYQDFQILVDKNNNIRADSEQGEVSDELRLNKNEIESNLKLIESGQTDRELLKALGNTLYQALFPNNINARFHATMAGAAFNNQSVRLRLIFQSPELAALPWEFLYDESTNTFLANNTQTVLSRYVDVPLLKREIKGASLPLKVLLVISSPSNLPQLDTTGEENLIREALAKYIEAGQVELDILQSATIRNINQKLREKPYNVFHFIGHGEFKDNKGYIELVDNDGKAKSLDDESFANLFLGNNYLGLVILNSCKGATISSNQAFAGTAPNLVRRGIPAVIAMQYSILDDTAKIFSDEFYRTLALGYPVDAAIQSTRNAISMEVGLEKRDFATPVLYMRAKDGVIF